MVGNIKLDLSLYCDIAPQNMQSGPGLQRNQSSDQHFTLAGADVAMLKKGRCPLELQCWREAEAIWSTAARDPGR